MVGRGNVGMALPVAILNGGPLVGKPCWAFAESSGWGGEQTGIAASRDTCHNTLFPGLRPVWAVGRGGDLAAHKW